MGSITTSSFRRAHIGVVELLVEEYDAPLDVPQKDGQTAAQLLQRIRRKDVHQVLQELQGKQRKSALIAAVNELDEGALNNLLDTPMIAEFKCSEKEDTLLHLASSKGSTEIVRLLIAKAGANVEATNLDGETPLHVAVKAGHMEVVNQLVRDHSASTTAKDRAGLTPIAVAKHHQHAEVVLLLNTLNASKNKPQPPAPISLPEDHSSQSWNSIGGMSMDVSNRFETAAPASPFNSFGSPATPPHPPPPASRCGRHLLALRDSVHVHDPFQVSGLKNWWISGNKIRWSG